MRVAATITIPAGHPAFTGHFPGTPILPGVLLLDETLRALERPGDAARVQWRIASAKFLKPVGPGEQLQIENESLPNGSVRFNVFSAGTLVATGTLAPAQAVKAHGHAE